MSAGSSVQLSESELWSAFKSGDAHAFRQMFDRYNNSLFKYGMHLRYDRELVKDAIQEVFARIWKNRANLADVSSIGAYLMLSTRREIMSKIVGTKDVQTSNVHFLPDANLEQSAEDKLIDREKSDHLRYRMSNLVSQLPARQKEIVFLRYYCNLDFEEIASITSLNNQVIRNTLCRAIKTLRKNVVITALAKSVLLLLSLALG